MIKRILWASLPLICMSCGSNESNALPDELLSGSTWEYRFSNKRPPTSVPPLSYDFLKKLLEDFPDIKYHIETIPYTEKNDTSVAKTQDTYSSLEFGVGTCHFIEENFNRAIVQVRRFENELQYFEAGKYTNPQGGQLRIASNGIFLLRNAKEEQVIALDDFKRLFFLGEFIVDEQEVKLNLDKKEQRFSFKRVDHEVILQSGKTKWVGTFNAKNSEIDVYEVAPKERVINTYSKK